MMRNKLPRLKFSRREFLKLGARGVLLTALSGGALSTLTRLYPSQAAPAPPQPQPQAALPPQRPAALPTINLRLLATDGFISLPGRRIFANPATVPDPFAVDPDAGDPDTGVYVFGFVKTALPAINENIDAFKGKVQGPSPIIGVPANRDLYITMTNLGFVIRPDLDDAHTIHWHGFRNPHAVFDGVPEVSISVPPARDFPYFFRPRVPGTYMYHCHFEDTEHVQMGMDGVIYIQPVDSSDNPLAQAYDHSSTAYDRHYALLLNELDTTPHDGLAAVQEFVWSDYDPNYWLINSRSYPDTILSDSQIVGTELAVRQPISSLIQALPGDRVLLRMVNLGYEQQAMQMLGLRMTVIGQDATFLGPLAYETHTIYIGPGESRDVLFTAPDYDGSLAGGSDAAGDYNVYWFKNHHPQRLVNGFEDHDNIVVPVGTAEDIFGDPAPLGGQITQVRVYDPGNHHSDLDAGQDYANQTAPKVV